MNNSDLIVNIFDLNKNNIGKGRLLSITLNKIIVNGTNLPVLNSGTHIYINIYDEKTIITPYYCVISVASNNQINAQIIRKEQVIERRSSFRMQTDLFFYTDKIYRKNEDITCDIPDAKINILNISVGGMLISSSYQFNINDEITFYFNYFENKPIYLNAKIIRKEEIEYKDNEDKILINYGCVFFNITNYDISIILKYIFERQLQLNNTNN